MVRYQRFHQLRKGEVAVMEEDEESQALVLVFGNSGYNKRTRPKLLSLLFLSLLSCCLILAPQLFNFPPNFSLLSSFRLEDENLVNGMDVNASLCSSISTGSICCDRSSIRSDICMMKGDVRTHSVSSSIYLYSPKNTSDFIDNVPGMANDGKQEDEENLQHEKIKPYTRKWETSVMNTIDELDLISKKENLGAQHLCNVQHDVPAVFFSTGGYTGNVYHEFNDGILPLYITSQRFNKKVVFVILEYHNWWISKYRDILSLLSDYPPIDFSGDKRIHCFPEAIVGLRIHDELTVDSSLMEGRKTIRDFRDLLNRAYEPRIRGLIQEKGHEGQLKSNQKLPIVPSSEMIQEKGELKKPKLVILARNGSRAITNEDSLVKMAEQIGFQVKVLRPNPTTELAKIYRALNSSDVMVGVHGAAMTHFLFLKPGSVFIQVVPLGTEWAAETYYGEPARKLGLKYIGYKILPRESSLYDDYDKSDPVLIDPNGVAKKGWQFTKKIYLDHQNVRLNLGRFRKRLVRAYDHSFAKMNKHVHHQPQ